jgi:GNAT superfamily N-acetyltransferase
MDETEIRARAELNMLESFRVLARVADAGELREAEGVLIAATGLPMAMFNVAFVTRPLRDPHQQLAASVAFFDARELPFIVRIREGLDAATDAALPGIGLPFRDTVPAMVLDDASVRGSFAEGLSIVTAATDEQREQHLAVNGEAYGMSRDAALSLLPHRALDELDEELYVGYRAGVPVAASALVVTPGVAGVYNVATVPNSRNQGLGAAMTWHAIRRGHARGCSIATLQSSAMGFHVYQQMGFRQVAGYRTFHR